MRLKIAAKIGLGFGILTTAVIINAFLTSIELQNSREINEKINKVYYPSKEKISQLYEKINNSRMLVKSWVYIDLKSDTPDKIALYQLHNDIYPELYADLSEYSEEWVNDNPELKKDFESIHTNIKDTLFDFHQTVMSNLNSFESYDNQLLVFEMRDLAEEEGKIMIKTNEILDQISELRDKIDTIVMSGSDEITDSFESFKDFIIIMAIILVIASLLSAVFTIRSLVAPINNTKNALSLMSKGVLPKNQMKEGSDELGQMAQALNALVNSLKNIFNFTNEIGRGNFDTEFEALSDDDILGHSLLEMRDELKKASIEEEKRKQEDNQRKWATEGIAKFSNILRNNNDNLNELSYQIISNLIKYLEANQGGVFLMNNNDKNNVYLEMSACYAYSRKKYVSKKVEIGEGLIGRCVQEKDFIYITEIPEDYINITSGLGDGNPTSILLVPLIYNDEIFGVLEIASFDEIPEYQIEFVKQLAESIAATILSVKSNLKTTLLLEQSQQQAEEMAAQEEEMRQNMEELRATQEQTGRREDELRREIDRLRKKLKESNIQI